MDSFLLRRFYLGRGATIGEALVLVFLILNLEGVVDLGASIASYDLLPLSSPPK
jgi:hypothetical protein